MNRVVACLVVGLLAIGAPRPAQAYLKFGVLVGSGVIDLKWNQPVPYFVTERAVAGVTVPELRDAVTRAFATWQGVSTAAVRSQFRG